MDVFPPLMEPMVAAPSPLDILSKDCGLRATLLYLVGCVQRALLCFYSDSMTHSSSFFKVILSVKISPLGVFIVFVFL